MKTAPDFLEDAPADPEMEDLATGFTEVSKAIALVGSYQLQIAGLREQYPVDEAYPVDTKEGMDRAVEVRAAWRTPRFALEKAREAAKAPVLRLGKLIDQRAKAIEGQLRIGESNADQQIKAREAAIEAEKERKRQEQIELLASIRRCIAASFGPPADDLDLTGEQLALLRAECEGREITPETFGDLMPEAAEAKARALQWIDSHAESVRRREAEALRLKAEAEQLAAERAKFAEEQRQEAAARKLRQAEEDERLAVERERRRAAQAAEDEARTRERLAESERMRALQEAIAAERAEIDQARKEQREAEERAEATRKAKQEQEQAAKLAAEASERERRGRIEKAAPAMLVALMAWGSAEAQTGEAVRGNLHDEARAKRDQAVAAALGCEPVEVVYTVAKPKRARKAA